MEVLKWHAFVVLLSLFAFVISTIVLSILYSQAKEVTGNTPGNTSSVTPTTTTMPPVSLPWDEIRIPNSIAPSHYDLLLSPNIQEGSFTGRECVLIDLTAPQDYLVIHIKHLTVNKFVLYEGKVQLQQIPKATNAIPHAKAFEYPKTEFYVIQFEQPLVAPKEYTMYLEFNGTLTNGIVGLYRSSYDHPDGSKRQIASSKFQPTYARRAYPCFDEPKFKTTFKITIHRPSGYRALSNMPSKSGNEDPNIASDVIFETSVRMVTYLSCFVVSDFESITEKTDEEWKFAVWARPGQQKASRLALEDGIKMTKFYEVYFNIPYPLPKQDLIAIPEFSSGAMEHWGLVTFRETALLFDDSTGSQRNKKRVSSVVGHELAHQWFGNLVTMEWWNDLWLNEGFASYMEYKAVDQCHGDWEMNNFFPIDDLHIALDLDSKDNSHPIVQIVNNPDEITEIFDKISYSKGASVLRMLDTLLQENGVDNFKNGVHKYLIHNAYGNAETDDLWWYLNEDSAYDVPNIMATWTEQMGYPVVSVTIDRSKTPVKVILSQKKFSSSITQTYKSDQKSKFGYKWDIPINYVTKLHSKKPSAFTVFLRNKDEETIDVPVTTAGKDDWIKLNFEQKCFYRVNYEENEWKKLSEALENDLTVFAVSDRSHLLNDAFSLAKAKQLDYSIPMGLTQYLEKENHFLPWSVAYIELLSMYNLLYGTEVKTNLEIYIRKITTKQAVEILKDMTTVPSTPGDEEYKMSILDLSCVAGDQSCLDYAQKTLEEWKTGNEVPSSWRTLVYTEGMRLIGDKDMWEFMWNKYTKETNPQEKLRLLNGLANTQEIDLLKKYLTLAKTDVPSQDYFTVLKYISDNKVGNPLVWDFIRSEWEYLVDRFTLNDRYLGNLIPYVTKDFSTPDKLDEMKAFFKKYPDAGAGSRARKQALETVEANLTWVKSFKDVIKNWLAQNSSPN